MNLTVLSRYIVLKKRREERIRGSRISQGGDQPILVFLSSIEMRSARL